MVLYGTATASTLLEFKASLLSPCPSFGSRPVNPLIQPVKNTIFFPAIKHVSSNSPSQQFKKISNTFVASASTAEVDTLVEKLPADLNVTETEEPNSRVRLSVEVPPVVCEDCYRRVIREFMKKAKVPGFRPGKNVPESILINYIGKQNIQKAIVESILKRTLPHAMSSMTGKALEDSIRIVTKFSEMENTYSSLNSLRYDIIVDVAPEVKWVPEYGYKNLKIVVEIDSEIDAKKASEEELRRRHKSLGSLRIVTDRGVKLGDVAVLDISATTIEADDSDAKSIPSAESRGFQFDTEDGDRILPGFLEAITGIQRGETKTFQYVFPESWAQENLRGIEAKFTVECKELFYRDLPDLDDSIADKLLPGCTTLEEVKKALLEKCLEVEQTAKEQAADNAILDRLCKFSTEELVKEVKNSIAEFKRHNQEYDEERVKEQVQEVLEGAEVLEWLRENAEIQYTTR